jgi:hypothetical protein
MQKGMRNNGTELGELRKVRFAAAQKERNILNTKGNGK